MLATTGAARKLLSRAIEPVAAGIQHMIAPTSRKGPKHTAAKWCEQVGAEAAAYITVKSVLSDNAERPLRNVALHISGAILDELRYRRFREQAPNLFRYRMSRFSTSSYRHMKRSLDATMGYAVEQGTVDVSDLEIPTSQRLLLGCKLIDILVETTGLAEVKSRLKPRKGKRAAIKSDLTVCLTNETLEWMSRRNELLEFLNPYRMPMVVPPLPWGPYGELGGYMFAMRGRHELVRGISRDWQKRVQETDMPQVYEALNRIQDTAWTINNRVLDVVCTIVDLKLPVAGLVSLDEDEPAKPLDIAENEQARFEWRKRSAGVKDRNHRRRSKRQVVHRTLSAAESLRTIPQFYFPHSLDFRGRIYALTTDLTPQGNDLSKGLLLFADKQPLGPDGAGWLAVHGANVLGVLPDGRKTSTLTLQERADWIQAHTADIQSYAADPLGNRGWAEAEKPLQFLAFCYEWDGFAKAYARGQGEEYKCGLPVAQDGSCNGIQHFSAMLRDPQGGRAVNLIPSQYPSDLYGIIAGDVLDILESSADPLAPLWLRSGVVDRKLTKRPTMTFGYGSRKYGFGTQVMDYMVGLDNWRDLRPLFTDEAGVDLLPSTSKLMAQAIWDALRTRVVAAHNAMEWMRESVTKLATQGQPVHWRVPGTGFLVRQEYFKDSVKQIKTVIAGKIRQPTIYTPTDKVLAEKQRNAVAPNFVHSLDAACLMLTVCAAGKEGITSFGMVHDSYSTLPANAARLARITRETFVEYYEQHDPVASLYLDLMNQHRAESEEDVLPEPPAKGELDIRGVLDSPYFFS